MIRFDPRTKLALGFMGLLVVLFTQRPVTLLVESCLLVILMFSLRLAGSWVRSLRLMVPMVGIVFLISLLSLDLRIALLLSIRLLNLLTLSLIFFRKISPEEIGDALRKMRVPFQFSFILTTSLRYVPLIGQKIRSIFDAQRSRGIDLRPRPGNLGNFMALFMPLLVQSFVLAEELAMAMESRGFAIKGRTFRRDYRLSPWEYGLMIFSLALLVVFVWWERR